MGTILLVDDEKTILGALTQVILDDEPDLSVITARDGASALELLGAHDVDVVISDRMMPGMDGVSLLIKIKELSPDVSRILLTEDEKPNTDEIVAALGENIPVITKPWDAGELRKTLHDTLKFRELDDEQAALVRFAGVTTEQLERADRIRKRLDKDRPIGEVLVELGALSRSDYNLALQARRSRMSVIDLLIEDGHLGEDEAAAYGKLKQESPERDDRSILVEGELVTEEQFLQAFCSKRGVPFVEPEVGSVDSQLLGKTSIRYLRRHCTLPTRILNGKLHLIIDDPMKTELLGELRRLFGVPIEISCATRGKILEALNTLESLRGEKGSDPEGELQYRELQNVDAEDETGEEAVQIVDYVLVRAVQLGASDLHIEPQKSKVRVRVRVDGVLQQLTDLPSEFAPRICSRIKILAGADIAEKRQHQDGRIFVKIEGREIDIRMSSYVTTFGETIVMRLLDRNKGLLPFDKIGFEPKIGVSLDHIVLETSSGLVLVTGPTGSGKTTTLYSFIDYCNDPTEKVITAEDPVEFVLDGIVQCSVNSKTGPTFGDSLRAIVRQDPDTIVVGEIRDRETAALALESALTGHKVFSTFHTEDAVGAVIRLLEMGTEPFLVASTLGAIIAQRLVRRLCENCRQPGTATRAELRFLKLERSDLKHVELWEPGGCARCDGSGYKGRLGVHEVLIPDDDFRDIILHRSPAKVLRDAARKLPEFMTLQENGLLKVAAGHTSLKEIVANAPRDTSARPIRTLTAIGMTGRTR